MSQVMDSSGLSGLTRIFLIIIFYLKSMTRILDIFYIKKYACHLNIFLQKKKEQFLKSKISEQLKCQLPLKK